MPGKGVAPSSVMPSNQSLPVARPIVVPAGKQTVIAGIGKGELMPTIDVVPTYPTLTSPIGSGSGSGSGSDKATDGNAMDILKKYWWLIALLIVVLIFKK